MVMFNLVWMCIRQRVIMLMIKDNMIAAKIMLDHL